MSETYDVYLGSHHVGNIVTNPMGDKSITNMFGSVATAKAGLGTDDRCDMHIDFTKVSKIADGRWRLERRNEASSPAAQVALR